MTQFRRCAVAIVAFAFLAGAGIALAHPLPHRSWSKLSTEKRSKVLKVQITHDLGVLSFFKQNPRIVADVSFVAGKQIKWHRVSLRIAKHNLAKLERLAATSGPVPWWWEMLHECEQPGPWTNGGPGSTFSGGLGLHISTWASFRLPGMPSWAGGASSWQQIAVARRVMQRYGASPWAGCSPKAQAVINQEHL